MGHRGMRALCIFPEQIDGETLPEGWDEWRTKATCNHGYCIEVAGYAREFNLMRTHTMTREERDEIRSDTELMREEFHGQDLD